MVQYKNRYRDIFTFTKTEDGNILWQGNFEFVRYAYPNVYEDAYQAYINDGSPEGDMTFEEFQDTIHAYDYKTEQYAIKNRKYAELVFSDQSRIVMIDPSGGPYLTIGSNMGLFDESFKGLFIKGFIKTPEGYLIITKE
jgi:nitrous oxide reductase